MNCRLPPLSAQMVTDTSQWSTDWKANFIFAMDFNGNLRHTVSIDNGYTPWDCAVVNRQLWVGCVRGDIVIMSSQWNNNHFLSWLSGYLSSAFWILPLYCGRSHQLMTYQSVCHCLDQLGSCSLHSFICCSEYIFLSGTWKFYPLTNVYPYLNVRQCTDG